MPEYLVRQSWHTYTEHAVRANSPEEAERVRDSTDYKDDLHQLLDNLIPAGLAEVREAPRPELFACRNVSQPARSPRPEPGM